MPALPEEPAIRARGGQPRTRQQPEKLAGLVERVTFHNPDNGFCVLRVKARGQRDLVTVVGHAPTISAGEFVQATGTWVNDRTHGPQFKASFLRAAPPTTVEGIEKYLGSGMIKGSAPSTANGWCRRSARRCSTSSRAARAAPEVDGIGPKRAERIVAGWADQKVIREIMIFLHSHGVSTSRVGADLQDLRRRRHPGPLGEPLPPRPRCARDRLQDGRHHRSQAGDREDRHDPGARRHRLHARPRPWTTATAVCPSTSWCPWRSSCSRSRHRSSRRRWTWSWRPARWWRTRSTAAAASSWRGCIGQNEPSRIV